MKATMPTLGHGLLLRLTMSRLDERDAEPLVNIELLQDAVSYGRWTFTATEMNVKLDPQALARLGDRNAVLDPLRDLTALCAQSLSDSFPTWLTVNRLDSLRQALSSDPSLPLVVSKALRDALEIRDVEHQPVVWLELAEPLGFLPMLPWERLLARAVGVPVLRLARRPAQEMRRLGTLDVFLACSATDESRMVNAKTLVAMCKAMLAGSPSARRFVIHLFADVLYRPALAAELAGSGLSVVERGEPESGRGVVLYPLPTESERALADAGQPRTVWERPWAAWARRELAGRAVDIVHFVTDAWAGSHQPSLEIAATPWEKPRQMGRNWTLRAVQEIEMRYVDAPVLSQFATGLGAWAIVLTAADGPAAQAQRALMHQVSGLLPGALAVHDLGFDSSKGACAALYRFLGEPRGAGDAPPFVPHDPALALQCHPALLQPREAQARIEASLGTEFADALRNLNEGMESLDSTPAWAAVLQRHIAQSASDTMASAAVTDSEKAERESAARAMTAAMSMLARHIKS